MSAIAAGRLKQERKSWRKDHPASFWARPLKDVDGSTNIFHWRAGIPGKEGTPWAGGTYIVDIVFKDDFPSKAPHVRFTPPVLHPNVYPNGNICLSILGKNWKPSITLKQILLGIQELLDNPNNSDPAQDEAYRLLKRSKHEYDKRIRQQAVKFSVNNV